MGNEQSQIPGIEIDQKVVELSDFWSQHSGKVLGADNASRLTLFIGDLLINEPFWNPITPLERFSKNLMIYRHPCIVKYISSWKKNSKFHLAVEEVTPLSHKIAKMSTLEISLGLYSILKALYFLHDKAMVSHNNVCLASIYVSKEGSWKLGGMEYLCRYKDLSADYLMKSRKHRYCKAVDSNEEKNLKNFTEGRDFIDVYAFCILVKELLKNHPEDDVPNLIQFRELCSKAIESPDKLQGLKLQFLMENPFFKHKFINIHSFLVELPLKSDLQKSEFFISLKDELEMMNEEIIASHLGGLLVSRMVFLNKEAQNYLLPYVLVPKNESNGALFSEEHFKKHIAPKLLKIFCVRDAQIRFLLLDYLPNNLCCFSKEELQMHILPHLLLGIKDTNDQLVAATLRILADLVPVLGAEIVIGGKRAKLFNDGRPNSYSLVKKPPNDVQLLISEPELTLTDIDQLSINSSMVELIQNHVLPERQRPDGEEGETSTEEIEQSADEDVENWEDWDNEIAETTIDTSSSQNTELMVSTTEPPMTATESAVKITLTNNHKKHNTILDITELDIKNQTKLPSEEIEVDFFQDMEPVIDVKNKFLVSDNIDNNKLMNSKLSINVEDSNEDGWGDDW